MAGLGFRAQRADFQRNLDDGDFEDDADLGVGSFDERLVFADDRLSQVRRRRGRRVASSLATALATAASTWGLLETQDTWRPYARPALETAIGEFERLRTAIADRSAPIETSARPERLEQPAPLATAAAVAAAPGAETGEKVAAPSEKAEASVPDKAETSAEEPAPPASGDDAASRPDPLPPPPVDESDPYQKRALAAGLHPGLSRAVLQRMSDEDYRNARQAVEKAIASLREGKKLVWPERRAPERALFTVHFVRGASDDCRRYVITVTMDRWTTTALPMERCGVHGAAVARRTAS